MIFYRFSSNELQKFFRIRSEWFALAQIQISEWIGIVLFGSELILIRYFRQFYITWKCVLKVKDVSNVEIYMWYMVLNKKLNTFKAMDQTGHMTRFLLYQHFSLCDPISMKNRIDNWKFVELNKIQYYRSIWS